MVLYRGSYLRICFSFVWVVLILFASCSNDNETEQPCIGNQICTDILVTINLTIIDEEGNPVVLDEYYTFIDSRTRIDLDRSAQQIEDGVYPVATDNNIEEIAFEGTTVVFVGVLEGENVIENTMVIEKDCCHISLVRGETGLILELQ